MNNIDGRLSARGEQGIERQIVQEKRPKEKLVV